MDGKKLNQLWRASRRPIAVVAAGVLFYEFLENLGPVTAAVKSFLSLLTPVFLAIAIAFLANMPMRFLETKVFKKWDPKRLNLRRGLSLLLAMLFLCAIVAAVFLMIVPKLEESATSLVEGFDDYVRSFTVWAQGILYRVSLPAEMEGVIQSFWQKFVASLDGVISAAASAALRFTVGVASFVINVLLAVVISFYALYNKEKLIFQFKKLAVAVLSDKAATKTLEVCAQANSTLNHYFFGMILECSILGLMTFVAMSIFNFPYALLISVIVGITQMVPIIGPWFSGAVGAVIILVTDPPMALWFVVLLLIVQQLEANLIYPRVVGNAVGLSGIWVMIAVILGGGLFGIPGVILCVPVMAVLYTLVSEWVNRRVEEKRFAMGMRDTPPTDDEIKDMTD